MGRVILLLPHPRLSYHENVITALVLSAGGLYGAWEVGVWTALRKRIAVDLVVGASAGAWNGWAIAGGAAPEELEAEWRDPLTARLLEPGLHAFGILKPDALHEKARELFGRYRPRMDFGLTMVQVPRMRARVCRGAEITWRHLAATVSIPLCFPPVRIDGHDFVDGGLVGALPLWAADELGARRAIAVNALVNPSFRLLHTFTKPLRPRHQLDVALIEPSRRLGSLRDAVVWSEDNISRWIREGEEDGEREWPRLERWMHAGAAGG